MIGLRFSLVIISTFIFSIDGFASWFVKDYCDRSLAIGEIIMNEAVVYSDQRTVQVLRGVEDISDSGFYTPGELLTVKISDTNNQYIIEVINAQIVDGDCDGRRVANKNNVVVKMPVNGAVVSVLAGWAAGHSAVSITESLVFKASAKRVSDRPLAHRSAGRSRVTALKTTTTEEGVDEEEEDDEETHPPIVVHRGRVDYTVKGAKKTKPKLDVAAEELTSNNKETGGLRGGGRLSSVDSPQVFESRPGRSKHQAPSANSLGAVVSNDSNSDKADVETEGDGKQQHQQQQEDVRKKAGRRERKKKDKKPVGRASRNPLDYIIHINFTTFEKWVVAVLFVGMLATAMYQMCTGKFKFQLLKSVNIMRGGGRVE